MNYGTKLAVLARRYGHKPAFIWDGQSWSYQQLWQAAQDVRKRIPQLAAHRVVAIYTSQPIQQYIAFIAVQLQGAVPVIIHESLRGLALRQLCRTRQLAHWLVENKGQWTYRQFQCIPVETAPAAVTLAVLSSGTSGVPKILYRTYTSWAGFFAQQNEVFHIGEAARVYVQGSFSFTGNLNMILAALDAGSTVIGTTLLRPKYWHELIARQGATHIYLIPAKLKALCRVPGKALMVQYLLSGSQLITPALLTALTTKFPQSRTILYYGSTELNYVSYITGQEIREMPDSVGRPFPGVHVTARRGVLFADSPYLVYGVPHPYTSGDLVTIDDGGFIHFQGRQGDMYNLKGNHISKMQILSCLLAVPQVAEAEIVPFATVQGEEKLAAFISPLQVQKDAVMRQLQRTLPTWAMPAQYIFVEQLPRTATGKPDFAALRQVIANKK